MTHTNRAAIVGVGGIFSESPTLDAFWDNIRRARDTSREVPAGRWALDAKDVCDAGIAVADKLYCTRGYFVDEPPIDTSDLFIEPALLAQLDPVFHLTIHAGRAAWTDAKTEHIDRDRVGMIFGNIVLPTEKTSALTHEILGAVAEEQITGDSEPPNLPNPLNRYAAGMPAGILAKALGLGGGCFTLDAACASSLFALKIAVDKLLAHEVDAMLAGGVSRPDCLYTQMGFSQLRALSPTGRCQPFDAEGAGLIVGEGAGFFVLKRLSDAIAHGDRIYATIAGIGLSNDIGGNVLAPSSEGQLRAMHVAYRQAGWRPKEVDFIECHATGTPVGDAVEIQSLRQLWQGGSWRPQQCVLGSVKSNVGHTLTAAGAAGLLKILLALKHETLPPTANYQSPRDTDLHNSPFQVLRDAKPWPSPQGRPRRAAISAFGFGGTNAHVLLEEWQPSSASRFIPTGHQFALTEKKSIAIVGMDAHFGPWSEVAALRRRFSSQAQETGPASLSQKWWGVDQTNWFQQQYVAEQFTAFSINEVAVAVNEFRVAPRDLQQMLPQQLLMLKVAARVLNAAALSDDERLRTGVFIGLALDLNTTNYHLRWSMLERARRWNKSLSPHLSDEALQDWIGDLREQTVPPLSAERVLGSLASITASRIARVFGLGGPSFTVSSEQTSGLSALEIASRLLALNELDYAVVGAVDFPSDVRACLSANKQTEIIGDGAAAILLRRLGDARRDGNEIIAVMNDITSSSRQTTIGDNSHDTAKYIGHTGAASGLAALVHTITSTAHQSTLTCSSITGNACSVHLSEISPEWHSMASQSEPQPINDDKKQLAVSVGHPPLELSLPKWHDYKAQELTQENHVSDKENDSIDETRKTESLAPASAAFVESLIATQSAKAKAHESFLQFAENAQQLAEQHLSSRPRKPKPPTQTVAPANRIDTPPAALNRDQCLEFAVGAIANVLGPAFAEIDRYPTRVRLPAAPLMLVDRILAIEGETNSLTSGRVVTEHDVLPDDWYLDNNQMPASLTIESGQADLFLSAYLGIDSRTKGLAVYRLLDAAVTFHRGLPAAGEVVHYDIHIDNFFRQGDTHLFRFRFEGTVNGQPLLTMRDGCAGFFTEMELASGKGIVEAKNSALRHAGKKTHETWEHLVPLQSGTFDEEQLDALRAGDLAAVFGPPFDTLQIQQPLTLPAGRLRVIHRIVTMDPDGGKFKNGLIRSEQDIHPDDWFLTCHFIDDQVMPGTLMYECCLHTLRFYLLRMGWIAEALDARFEPKPGIEARLKCRGQVTASTKTASYEIIIREFGEKPHPYAIADAIMYADGKAIVEITNMSLQLSGVSYEELRQEWASTQTTAPQLVFTNEQILAFARGNPSEAYGEPYKVFDRDRRMARLPAPPYSYIDRVLSATAEPWQMVAGGTAITEYDIPPNAWYFQSNRQRTLPFAVLLEAALQSCGWMAAYIGSALTSDADLRFRNLGGSARYLELIDTDSGTLQTTVTFTKVSTSAGMIIQHYDFTVRNQGRTVYEGDTYFGFFTDQALAQQVGIRDASPYKPSPDELGRSRCFAYPVEAPFPDRQWRMVDHVELFIPDGGPQQRGLIAGSYDVDPDAWFFKAHFFQDPVCPGSLGLESLLQLLKVFARERFGAEKATRFVTPVVGKQHCWSYRGQILPSNSKVDVQAEITAIDDDKNWIQADGWLSVDGLVIYQMNDFTLQVVD